MNRLFGLLGALAGGIGVLAGAFGAHALKEAIPADRLEVFKTAVLYQLVHALALLAVGLWESRTPRRAFAVAGWAFVAGIVLFSGSLYALALSGVKALGAITPFGGVAFLVGWVALAVAASNRPAGT